METCNHRKGLCSAVFMSKSSRCRRGKPLLRFASSAIGTDREEAAAVCIFSSCTYVSLGFWPLSLGNEIFLWMSNISSNAWFEERVGKSDGDFVQTRIDMLKAPLFPSQMMDAHRMWNFTSIYSKFKRNSFISVQIFLLTHTRHAWSTICLRYVTMVLWSSLSPLWLEIALNKTFKNLSYFLLILSYNFFPSWWYLI